VVNIQSLIDNNLIYNNTINELEKNRIDILKRFEKKEIELKNVFDEIENSKLILDVDEINIQIDNYNNKLSKFTILVEEFNLHYQNQIYDIRQIMLKEIVILLEKYAIENNVDLILDSTSYLIASNSIDITNSISDELKKINIILEYINFEKY
tara:strand:- start:10 stop:468 length:459 start_codon:yes stop_codon:yes gene_type:complete